MFTEKHGIRIEIHSIGEGYQGDYDESDPEDRELLRFDTLTQDEDGNWEQIPDGSYCTSLPADLSEDKQTVALEILAARIVPVVLSGHWKRVCEELSWIDETWLAPQ